MTNRDSTYNKLEIKLMIMQITSYFVWMHKTLKLTQNIMRKKDHLAKLVDISHHTIWNKFCFWKHDRHRDDARVQGSLKKPDPELKRIKKFVFLADFIKLRIVL